MSFDIQGALKAGYSEKEIVDFLTQEGGSDFDVAGARSAGYSDREILDFLNQDAPVSVPEESGLQLEQPEVDLDDMPGYRGAVESTSKAMENLPRSFAEEAGGLVDAITDPIGTAANVGRIVAGGAQKGARALGADIGEGYIPYADQIADVYADRYGSWDKTRKTFEENPVALMGDLTALLSGGGTALTAAGKLGKAGNVVSKAGSALNKAAVATDPLTLPGAVAGELVGRPAKKLVSAIIPSPERLYGSAIKGLSALPVEAQKHVVDIALKERILPTEAGFGKIQDIQKEVGSKVGKLIDDRAAAELAGLIPLAIDADSILHRALDTVRKGEKGPYKAKRLKEAQKAARVYRKGYQGPIDTRTAQDLKRGAQDEARSTYAETGGKAPMDKQLANAIAHEARMDIENLLPEVAPLNARLHDLYPLEDILGTAIGRETGRNLISFPSHIAGFGMGGPAGMVGVGALNVGRMPGTKGRAAFALDSLRKLPDNKRYQAFMAAQRPYRSVAHVESLLDLLAKEEEKKKE